MEKTFIRVRSAKDILIFLSLIILGSILIALPTGAGINIAGFFMIFAGIIVALVLRTAYKDTETGVKYSKKEHYFQQSMMAQLNEAIKHNPSSIDLGEEDKGNAVKLDVYYNKSLGKAYLQTLEYVPYTYLPCSNVYEYEIEAVEKLIK